MRRGCQDRHWYLPLDLPLIVGKERRPKQQALPEDAALFIGRNRYIDGNFLAPNLDFCLLCVTQILKPLRFPCRSSTRASHDKLAIVIEIRNRRGVRVAGLTARDRDQQHRHAANLAHQSATAGSVQAIAQRPTCTHQRFRDGHVGKSLICVMAPGENAVLRLHA
jgi:hypothetical protein